jgi:hypothetical protein
VGVLPFAKVLRSRDVGEANDPQLTEIEKGDAGDVDRPSHTYDLSSYAAVDDSADSSASWWLALQCAGQHSMHRHAAGPGNPPHGQIQRLAFDDPCSEKK